MSSNKPGNSFLRKASYVFPVKLLSNTKDPINLLPSIPHHTFKENLLWKWVTHIACGLRWAHLWTFRKLFVPSRVKDASSVNKIAFNSSGCAFTQWHKPIRLAWSPGSKCCTLWSWYGYKFSSCNVRHTFILDNPTREAIRRVDRRGLLCTMSRMFSRTFIVCTISLSECKAKLGRQQLSRNDCSTRVNMRLDRILLSG